VLREIENKIYISAVICRPCRLLRRGFNMERNNKGKKYLKVEEVASRIRTTKGNVYNMIRKKQIPYMKIKGLGIRFCAVLIDGWMSDAKID